MKRALFVLTLGLCNVGCAMSWQRREEFTLAAVSWFVAGWCIAFATVVAVESLENHQ